jgi:recombination protein RecR
MQGGVIGGAGERSGAKAASPETKPRPDRSGLLSSPTESPTEPRAEAPAAHARTASKAPKRSTTPSASAYPASVTELIDQFAKLPGIGRRSAERLAFHVLKSPRDEAIALSKALADVKQSVRPCRVCYNLTDWGQPAPVASTAPAALPEALCSVCADERRDRSRVMVVEQPKDLIALEQTGAFKGLYHVLMGRIAPLEGVGPGDLTIADLLARVDRPADPRSGNAGGVPIVEVILALNPTLEGDGTGLYLASALAGRAVRVTRLARGVPAGAPLEFANKAVLSEAIVERRGMD